MLELGLLLFACRGNDKESEPNADDSTSADDSADDTATPPVDIDWGVVDGCSVSAAAGFDDFWEAGTALVVYGDEETAFVSRFVEWYGLHLTLDVRAYGDLTETDKQQQNLFVIGSPASNALLKEMNGALPVWFEDGEFVFGGRRYTDHGNGIAFIHPSPFAADKWIVVYAGNSFEGMYSTFTIWTGAADFETTRGRGVLMQEGKLCRDGSTWGWNADLVTTDEWPTWEGWLDGTEELVTAHHVFHYVPGSYAAANIDWSSEAQEERYQDVLDTLEIESLDEPIATHLYPDNDTKGEITGVYGNGHANDLNYETHMVFGEDVNAFTIHEDVHVIAAYRIGETHYALLGEGLAVAMGGEWWGESLSSWASELASEGSLPSLAQLQDDFWSIGDATSYPVAGYFVEWLLETYGVDAVKALYVAPDLDDAFESELGMTHDEVEKAWLASIP
jgi:hypothetical protein